MKGATSRLNASQEWLRTSLRTYNPMPPEVDRTTPSVVRVWDYALGGRNNFAVDRAAVDALEERFPGIRDVARSIRSFLHRGVRYLVRELGVRQFIDFGSRLPNLGNVHEVAHAIDPDIRVVYVDSDPVVLTHIQATLKDNDTVTTVEADLANPGPIFEDPSLRDYIDFSQPVGILMAGVLHHLSDSQNPVAVVQAIKDRMPSGSYLLICNLLGDDSERTYELEQEFIDRFKSGWFRAWDEQYPYFDGLEMVSPGFVYANDWRPDEETLRESPWHTFTCGGLGRKP